MARVKNLDGDGDEFGDIVDEIPRSHKLGETLGNRTRDLDAHCEKISGKQRGEKNQQCTYVHARAHARNR
jgi:hypothetical protein